MQLSCMWGPSCTLCHTVTMFVTIACAPARRSDAEIGKGGSGTRGSVAQRVPPALAAAALPGPSAPASGTEAPWIPLGALSRPGGRHLETEPTAARSPGKGPDAAHLMRHWGCMCPAGPRGPGRSTVHGARGAAKDILGGTSGLLLPLREQRLARGSRDNSCREPEAKALRWPVSC